MAKRARSFDAHLVSSRPYARLPAVAMCTSRSRGSRFGRSRDQTRNIFQGCDALARSEIWRTASGPRYRRLGSRPIAVPRAPAEAENEVRSFCSGSEKWVVEGCYANLVNVALAFSPRLLFLNPGEEQCLANCRSRPWEPHKYDSKDEQDTRLPFLLSWVGEYYRRVGEMSLAGHASCFASYVGPKCELRTLPVLTPPSPEVLTWID